MRILVDMAHPANVHYFRGFIKAMEAKGHQVQVTCRDKDVALSLLNAYDIPFYNMGKGIIGKGILGKILYIIWADFLMIKQFIKFKPDIAVSFCASYVAHSCFLFRKPHIAFTDTEHAKMNELLYKPFTKVVLTPASFYRDLGKRHYRFNSYMELFYLYPSVFIPDPSILSQIGIHEGEVFTLFRYVSWGAFHDIGQGGIPDNEKLELVKKAKTFGKVVISSEGELPEELKEYQVRIKPEHIHSLMYYSSLYVGEGGTMASESVMLGVPAIYINSLPLMGYLNDAKDYGLLYHLKSFEDISSQMVDLLSNSNTKSKAQKSINRMLSDKIEPTSFLIDFVENYPKSLSSFKR